MKLSGAPAAEALLHKAQNLMQQLAFTPHLHVVRVGEDPASISYVQLKDQKAKHLGLSSTVHVLPETTSEAELLDVIAQLNTHPDAHGILVQLPLPAHISSHKVIAAIHPAKDVDGFHPSNVGRLWLGEPCLMPCTPAGIIALCAFYGIPLSGKHVVIVGRSNIVGKPLAALLLAEHATVTIAHSRSVNLANITQNADIVVAAVGKAGVITAEMISPSAIVLDVGVNRITLPNGKTKLVGDCTPETYQKAAHYTPVPGGIGPMTVAHLLYNTVSAAQQHTQQQL